MHALPLQLFILAFLFGIVCLLATKDIDSEKFKTERHVMAVIGLILSVFMFFDLIFMTFYYIKF